jgi:hypothetical protein
MTLLMVCYSKLPDKCACAESLVQVVDSSGSRCGGLGLSVQKGLPSLCSLRQQNPIITNTACWCCIAISEPESWGNCGKVYIFAWIVRDVWRSSRRLAAVHECIEVSRGTIKSASRIGCYYLT